MKAHHLLQKHFEKKKQSTHGFSMRVLAKKLSISPSFVSRILSGKKPIPYPVLIKMRSALDLDNETFSLFQHTFYPPKSASTQPQHRELDTSTECWNLANNAEFSILRHWFYLPVLECTTLKNYDGTAKMIAEKLSLSETAVGVAIREMASVGLMKLENDKWVKTKSKIRWGSAKSSADIRSFHKQMLLKAQNELSEKTSDEDFNKRLITGITVTASPEKIKAAKQKLSEALHEIANDLIDNEGTEVYHLAAQLFPLSK